MNSADDAAGVDTTAVVAWIESTVAGVRPPLRFRRIGNGFSNLTILVTDAGDRAFVLRRPPHGELLASAHDVEREYGILRALERTAVVSPRTVGLCTDDQVSPVPLMLMEYIDGLVVDSYAVAEGLAPSLRRRIGRALPAALAQVHAVDLAASGLAGLSRSKTPYAARQIRRWRGQWERSRTRDLAAVDSLADRLWAAMPAQTETCLVHGDFHLLNALVSPSDGGVRGILDWELTTLGDPLGDLGGFLAYWPGPGDPPGPLTPFGELDGFPSRAEMVEVYAEDAGRSTEAVAFWEALGIWKIAIIAEGVMRRYREDARNQGAATGPASHEIDELLVRAESVAAAAGI